MNFFCPIASYVNWGRMGAFVKALIPQMVLKSWNKQTSLTHQ